MESIIVKKIKVKTMFKLFNNDLINIRYYKAICYKENKKKYFYEIKIRHNENENPEELLLKTIKTIENGN